MRALQRLASAQARGEEDRRLTRAQFTKRVLGASAAALVAPQLCVPGISLARGRERVAIIGAGIAGLTTALHLHDAGIASTVYESSMRVGGRMHSETRYWKDGQHTEWCGAMVDSKHAHIRALARRFGLSLLDTFAAMQPRARDTSYFGGRYYPMQQADADFAAVYAVLQRQLQQIGAVTTYDRATPEAQRLDAMSVHDWIARYVPGGISSRMGQLLTCAYWNEYGVAPEQQSSLNLVYMLGIQPDYHGADGEMNVLGYSDQRYIIASGSQSLPQAIARALPAGSVKLGYRLLSLRKRRDGSYELHFQTPNGAVSEYADRVVLALSFAVLRGLDYSGAGFDTRKISAIDNLGYGLHSKLHVQFDTRPWMKRGPWPSPTDGQIWTDLPFQNSIEFSLGQRGACGLIERFTAGAPGLVDMPAQPYTYAGESPAVDRHVREFLTMLDRIWPGVSRSYNGKATMGNAQVDPNILASYSCWLVGQYTTIAGYERVRQGRVHFAGEHCSVEYQGFMEGGAETGAMAAREILADYGMRMRAAG